MRPVELGAWVLFAVLLAWVALWLVIHQRVTNASTCVKECARAGQVCEGVEHVGGVVVMRCRR